MSDENHSFAIKCREHWERLKLSNPDTLKKRIIEAFDPKHEPAAGCR